jgi:hypothetical protein
MVPGAWSSIRSVHACGKAVSTSALVDARALPPALDTRVQAGEGERDADDADTDADADADTDAGPSSGALSPLRTVTRVLRGAGGASASLRTPAPAPDPSASASTSGVGKSPPPAWPYEMVRSAADLQEGTVCKT